MSQIEMWSRQTAPSRTMQLEDASIRLQPGFMGEHEASKLLVALRAGLPWKQNHVRLFGKRHALPRLTAWCGDPDAEYAYSGLQNSPKPWTPELLAIRDRVEQATGVSFNSVLANLYRTGADHVGWHADDEPELGARPVIASVSLGTPRTFRLRHRTRKDLPPVAIELSHGSLLVMSGDTQRCWEHCVPPRKRVSLPRVNLTFRRILT